FPLDHGCGWLHSADRNPWTAIAAAQGKAIDKTRPPWERPGPEHLFSADQHREFWAALRDLFKAAERAAREGPDRALSDLLPPAGRWNAALNAASTYINGVELDRVSIYDTDRYDDTGVNWRVVEGYGAAIAAHAADLNVVLDCPVTRIDHGGARVRVETGRGAILAGQVIVTLPSSLIENENLFSPVLPVKIAAARGLPLGLADKLFLSLERPEEFEADVRIFGRTDRAGTGTYHFRPFGRPMIEAYYGGRCAEALEAGGERGFMDFAIEELTGVFGSDFAHRVSLIHVHRWRADPFARGSYSCALPGHSDDHAVLAAPVDDRLFFAGEACSPVDFSTAHGALATGIAAAGHALELRRERV
ncbi:MAG: flavin monoamine oxidase family protein, partial [Pseudolabrys sp.]